ncbi:MAG TPA: nitrogen regulation protein NR(I) [Candidatus Thiothrix moscowensis]|uniref:nitrogen regulation protein NR(I) n=1 Tax=unclassified Thiothrix TaxID=2636184 RepID=UPI0025E021C0|nr:MULTISPECIES: nitrogen regulation protein NR(I) [unclassified Thiothrix]HRJ51254.1 nitrogen regulation protein NR(I) [Candidatus Thiothrix moscowensis]HRJ91691.1 nitrogen regulation protein NR(I) [Candidatus Thiothrix moscowensis]
MTHSENIWVADDDRSIRWVLERALQKADIGVRSFETADQVIAALRSQQPDALMTDIRMPGTDGLLLLERMQREYPEIPVIIMTAHSDLESAVSAYQGGAFEYLPKPFDVNEAVDLVRRACKMRHEREANRSKETTPELLGGRDIIGHAPAMQEVFRAIGRLSKSSITVLITGESGTGKELVAKALHTHSPRANKPFIALNTAAIPRELLESELFGHEKGAFTGAYAQRKGRFEQADGGTLFLDEIGDMPAELQTRLLRVLAEGTFYRVGGHTPVKVDVRIIAATHQNLEELVHKGTFREDLFHRLNVIRIHNPPLRERREDIPLLLNHFLRRAAEELQVEVKTLSPLVTEHLQSLSWAGNVRQLENTCRWLTVMASGREIVMDDLPNELVDSAHDHKQEMPGSWEKALAQFADFRLNKGVHNLLDELSPVFERILLQAALKKTGGRKIEAAELLGWGRNTLTRKLKELGVEEG